MLVQVFHIHLVFKSRTAKAIDRYIESRSMENLTEKMDPRLQVIVEGIFKRCIEDGEHKQVRVS